MPIDTAVPMHRYLIEFENGTRRGFESEITNTTADRTRGEVQYTDWSYDANTSKVRILRRGSGMLQIPSSVKLAVLYKTG
jgi:hypothetical protein